MQKKQALEIQYWNFPTFGTTRRWIAPIRSNMLVTPTAAVQGVRNHSTAETLASTRGHIGSTLIKYKVALILLYLL